MSGFRQLHTRIWSDSWFTELKPEMKILFIYLFGNERASVCGLYELPIRTISFETGLDRDIVKKGLEVFNNADKVKYDFETSVIWVKNMRKYQATTSPKVQARIQADIKAVPECDLKKQFLDTLSIPYGKGSGTSILISSISQSQSLSLGEEGVQGEGNRVNVFRVYEQNIGALTPMIAEALRDAEKTDSAAWVCAAIDEAVKNNARSWKYCEAILSRWRKDGFRADTRPVETRGRSRPGGGLSPDQLQDWEESSKAAEEGRCQPKET
jgi:DnaD/phage-associated family protein